jgi:hypothetical protein
LDKARNIGRRSFLTRVAGGMFAVGSGLALGAANGAAQQTSRSAPKKQDMLVDADPGDPARPVPRPRPSYQGRQRPRPTISTSPMPPPSAPDGPVDTGRTGGPIQRFVVCPGNVRCPRRGP